MGQGQRYSIILGDDEIQALKASRAEALSRGDHDAAWQCEHQLKLSKLYERMRSQSQATRLEGIEEADTVGY